MFIRVLKDLKAQIEQILFGEGHYEQLGLFRLLLCGTLFYLACSRQLNMDQYGPLSIIPRDQALSMYPEFYRPLFQYFFWPDEWAATVHLGLIGLLFLATIGLTSRPLLLLTWVISQGFINRNFAILFGADVIGALFLFYLSFTKCTEFYSLKKFIFKKKPNQPHDPLKFGDQLSTVFFRLAQIQICVIYAYTGFEKLKGGSWWDGTALWTVFANPQFTPYDLIFLKDFPLFFAVGTFTTIVFEIYFPAMMLFKKTRWLWLGLGLTFHLAIGITLNLMPFSFIMLATYFLFLDRPILKHLKLLPSRL